MPPPRGINSPRFNGDNLDFGIPVETEFLTQGKAQAPYTSLGCGITGLVGKRGFTVHRTHIDQRPVALFYKLPYGNPAAIHKTFQVNVDYARLVLLGNFPKTA